MQSLILERTLNKTSSALIQRLYTELSYSFISELSSEDNSYPYKFPVRCHPSGINTLDLDHQTRSFLLSGGSDSSLKLWSLDEVEDAKRTQLQDDDDDDDEEPDKQTLKNILTVPRKLGHEFGVSSIKWWPQDNGMFLSASFDQTVKVWDTSTFEDVYSFKLDSKIYDIDVSKTGQHSLVATANESSLIRLLDLNSTSTSQTLRAHKGKILAVKWSPTNPYILASGGVDGELKIWDIRRAKSCVCSLDQFNVESSGNEESFNITSSPAKKRRIKDISSVKYKFDDQAPKSHNGTINSIIFSDLGDTIVSSGNDEKIKIWDLKPQRGQNMLVNFGPIVKNKYPQKLSPCLSPSQETELQYLWFPNDSGEILVFNMENGKLVSRLNQQNSNKKLNSKGSGYVLNNQRVTSIVYGDSGVYYSASLDGKITIWGPDLKYKAPNFKPNLDTDEELEDDESGSEDVLDSIHNELEARKLLQKNPFI